jgi:hypothetical protein
VSLPQKAKPATAVTVNRLQDDRLGGDVNPRPSYTNCLSLDKPLVRFEIPDDILKLAATEPLQPPPWHGTRRSFRKKPWGWSTGRQTDRGRTCTAGERLALMAARPDLERPSDARPANTGRYIADIRARLSSAEALALEGMRGRQC